MVQLHCSIHVLFSSLVLVFSPILSIFIMHPHVLNTVHRQWWSYSDLAGVFPTFRICWGCCCSKFNVSSRPLCLAHVVRRCACRTPEETTGIFNEEGTGARLHAPLLARLRGWQPEEKGAGWQDQTSSGVHANMYTYFSKEHMRSGHLWIWSDNEQNNMTA